MCIRRNRKLGKQHVQIVCLKLCWSGKDLREVLVSDWKGVLAKVGIKWHCTVDFPLRSIFSLYLQISTNFLISKTNKTALSQTEK